MILIPRKLRVSAPWSCLHSYGRKQSHEWHLKENISQYFHKKFLFDWICFLVPKIRYHKDFFLEIVDHIPAPNIKAPGNSAMVSMHSSIFSYLNVRTLAMISKTISWNDIEQLRLSSVLLFSWPFVLCRYICNDQRKTALFYGNFGNEIAFLEYVFFLCFILNLNRALKSLASSSSIKCLNAETFSLLAHYLGPSALFEKELFMGYQTTVLGERNLKNVLEPLGSFAEQEQQKLVPTLSASPARCPFAPACCHSGILPTMTWGQGPEMASLYLFKDMSGAVLERV